MQFRFIMILSTQGYNYLSYPTLHCKGWSTNVSKYKLTRIGQPNQLIQVKSFISVFLTNLITYFIESNNLCHKSSLAKHSD